MRIFQEHPDINFIFSQAYIISESKTFVSNIIPKIQGNGGEVNQLGVDPFAMLVSGDMKRCLYKGNFIIMSTAIMERKIIDKVSGFDEDCFGTEDKDLWIRVADQALFCYLQKPIVNYYRSSSSISLMSEKWLMELICYHKGRLSKPCYSEMHDLIYENLFKIYKHLIIFLSNKWNILKAWQIYFDSRKYPLKKGLFFYAIISFLGPIPSFFKNFPF